MATNRDWSNGLVELPTGTEVAYGAKTTGDASNSWQVTGAGAVKHGAVLADQASIKGTYLSGTVVVAVPTIADTKVDEVAVDVSAMTFACAVGDAVLAQPLEALPTDCVYLGARVTAADQVTVSFGTKEGGGGVTGANKNFTFLFHDLT